MKYKILYHVGENIGIRTKTPVGRLSIDRTCLHIQGSTDLTIPVDSLRSVNLFRLHGTGRIIKIEHSNGTVFVSVIRFNLFGYFAIINYFATGKLHEQLESLIRRGTGDLT